MYRLKNENVLPVDSTR